MTNDEIRAELKTLNERIQQLEKELKDSEQQETPEGFGGYYSGSGSRSGIGGPSGGGRTARPQRGSMVFKRENLPEKTIRREGCCSHCGNRQFVGYCNNCATCGVDLVYNAGLLPLTEEQVAEKAKAEGVTLKELRTLCPEQFSDNL